MNDSNFTGIRMKKRDWMRIPAYMRKLTNGPMVMATVAGRQTFVPVLIVG